MKRLLLLGACSATFFCFANGPVEEPAPVPEAPRVVPQIVKREIGFKIDPLSQELMDAGLTLDMIKEVISKELDLGSIGLNENLSLPGLSLRMRTIKVGLDYATYFQLSFLEEAMLVRNRAMYHATTWSQSSILACRPEELKNEVLDTVRILAQTFVRDYNKAMQPRAQ